MESKKLAVIFPGIGYTADRPLLHYSTRIAADDGYEIRIMNYTGFPSKVKGDRARMVESFYIAFHQATEMLADVDLTSYEDVLFIGKSVGTIVAAKIASESPAKDRIRLILYTPLDDTFSFDFGEAIAFTGDDDPWVGKEKSRIFALCEERKIPCALIPYANHSLESNDVFADMKELYRIMKETEKWIGRDTERINAAEPDEEKTKSMNTGIPLEIERKFLIRFPDLDLLEKICSKKIAITQTYLVSEKNQSRRIRKSECDGTTEYRYNEKEKISDLTRIERERRISEEEYTERMKEANPEAKTISKTRYCIPSGDLCFEIDIFPEWNDRAYAEVELESERQEYKIPDCISVIREVTEDSRYTNHSLALYGFVYDEI